MRVSLIVVTFLLYSTSVSTADDYCKTDELKAEKRVQLPGRPSWFISVHPDGKAVGVILANGNYIMSLDEAGSEGANKHIRVPGTVDPVWTPDGKYLTLPGAEFFEADQLIENLATETHSRNMSSSGELDGGGNPYQSLGLLSSEDASRSEYLYISDPNPVSSYNGLSYLVASESADGTIKNTREGMICDGIEGNTPMISRDGLYLSIMTENDDGSLTTKIFRTGKDQSECKLVLDTGMPTGKVSFDFNSNPRKIAFHVDRYETNNGWFASPGSQLSKDSFVMDISVDEMGKDDEQWNVDSLSRIGVTNEKGQGTYYPRFLKDGRVVAVEDRDDEYFLSVYNPEDAKKVNFEPADLYATSAGCEGAELVASSSYALGKLWNLVCSPLGEDGENRFRDTMLLTPFLNSKNCEELIEKKWTQYRSKVINPDSSDFEHCEDLTKEDLLAACPSENYTAANTVTQVTTAEVGEETDEMFVMSKCAGCHNQEHSGGGIRFQNSQGEANMGTYGDGVKGINSSTAMHSIRSVIDQSFTAAMPPEDAGEILSQEERQRVINYFNQFVSPGSDDAAYIDALINNTGFSNNRNE